MYENLMRMLDGSYSFTKNGMPYNCPNFGEWEEEFAEVDAWAKEHPKQMKYEQPLPVLTLTELKANKLNELETLFTIRTHGAIKTTQGYTMQFDVIDNLKMNGAITLMEAVGSTFGYITQANDETVYNVSIETMKQVLIEMLNAYAKCHARKQELRKQINNAQSKEELDEIVISWPV